MLNVVRDMPILLSVRTCTRHVSYVMFREYCLITLPRWITCSMVMSTLDYCNSLLYGGPMTTVDKLQYTQNVLACVVTQSGTGATQLPNRYSSSYTSFLSRSASTTSSHFSPTDHLGSQVPVYCTAATPQHQIAEVIYSSTLLCAAHKD